MKAKILTLIFCFATLLAYAENENNAFNASYKYSKKRTIDANFETIVGTSVALIGKYSDYKISSWEENYVSFHVEIIAKANKEEYAENLGTITLPLFQVLPSSSEIYIATSRRELPVGRLCNNVFSSYLMMSPLQAGAMSSSHT